MTGKSRNINSECHCTGFCSPESMTGILPSRRAAATYLQWHKSIDQKHLHFWPAPSYYFETKVWWPVHTVTIRLLIHVIWKFISEWNTHEPIWFHAMNKDVTSKQEQTKAAACTSWEFTATRDRFIAMSWNAATGRRQMVICFDMRNRSTEMKGHLRVLWKGAAFVQRHPITWSWMHWMLMFDVVAESRD